MKLMLLIIPTIQKTVKPMASGPGTRMSPGPERVVDPATRDAQRRPRRREAELAEELPAGAEVEQVVEERRAPRPARRRRAAR